MSIMSILDQKCIKLEKTLQLHAFGAPGTPLGAAGALLGNAPGAGGAGRAPGLPSKVKEKDVKEQ